MLRTCGVVTTGDLARFYHVIDGTAARAMSDRLAVSEWAVRDHTSAIRLFVALQLECAVISEPLTLPALAPA